MADVKIISPDGKQPMIRKVHDVQDELYDMLPPKMQHIRAIIHERRWKEAEEMITYEMKTLWWRTQALKKARKVLKRIQQLNNGDQKDGN